MRRRRAWCGLVVVIAAVAGCSSSATHEGSHVTRPVPHPPVAAVHQFPKGPASEPGAAGRPPPVPSSGAYLGASVQPAHYTEPGRVLAVAELEAQIGRRFDIVHTYRTIDQPFPSASDLAFIHDGSYLLLSWAMADTDQVAAGTYDTQIHELAEGIRKVGAPMFFEPRWEMDRPNLSSVVHSPAAFIAAWDHVHSIFNEVGVPNASWVWCPTAAGFADGRAGAYYPGDDEVDWVCADAYPGPDQLSFSALVSPFLRWAGQHGKPAMVGEFGVPRSFSPQRRAAWLASAEAATRADPDLKAVVYFDSGIQTAPAMYNFWLAADPETLSSYRQWARAPYFDVQQLVPKDDA